MMWQNKLECFAPAKFFMPGILIVGIGLTAAEEANMNFSMKNIRNDKLTTIN